MFGKVRALLEELLGRFEGLAEALNKKTKIWEESLAVLAQESQKFSKKLEELSGKVESLVLETQRIREEIAKTALEAQREGGKIALFLDGDYILHTFRYQLPDWRLPFSETLKTLAKKYGKIDEAKSFWEFLPESLATVLQRTGFEILLCPPRWEGQRGTTDEKIIEEVERLPPGSTILLLSGDKTLAEKARAIIEKKGGEFHQLFFDAFTSPPRLVGRELAIPLYQEKEKSAEEVSLWGRVYEKLTIGSISRKHLDFHEEFFLWVVNKILEIVPPSPTPPKDQPLPSLSNLAALLWETYHLYHPDEERVSIIDVKAIIKVLKDNDLLREKREGHRTLLYRVPHREWRGLREYLPSPKE